ncbi:sigma-70 family RNA polymerase sigma factor [Streptomyces sp. NPDC093224]|uniref:RNA polymerase sigma factor n=1 Tax=Streptomyces sp. NPDC093224 TaxID=3155198 RepID=UPI00342D87A4
MRNRGSYHRVLGDPPTDLTPEALRQWHQADRRLASYHRMVKSMVGPNHVDDVLSKARVKLHQHLLRHGPVGNVTSYFGTICHREGLDHIKHIAKLAEQFVGDSTSSLEDAAQRVRVVAVNGMTSVEVSDQVSRALKELEKTFTPRELTAWLLVEMYDLDSASIATHTGTSQSAVRQTVRRARSKLADPELQRRLREWTLTPE